LKRAAKSLGSPRSTLHHHELSRSRSCPP
jgi:hypothetical protein